MKEYIERAALYEAMNGQDCEFSLIDALALIGQFPIADVVEVRHGRWIDVSEESSNLNWKCSLCTKRVLQKSPYCPNCGARMDKEDEHEAG